MKKNYFNYTQVKDKYLLTNDLGRYMFLTKNELLRLIMDRLDPEEELTLRLKEQYFLYEVTMILWKRQVRNSGNIEGICFRELLFIFLY